MLLDRLKQVRAKLEKGWTQRCFARDDEGNRTQPCWPTAVSWCVLGACHFGDPDSYFGEVDLDARNALLEQLTTNSGLADWNDAQGRTQAEVLALVDKAIAAEEKRQAAPQSP